MESILRSLFNGKIIPWERRERHSEELLETVRKIEEEERYFTQKLSSEDCERFQKLARLRSDLESIEGQNDFSYGFTLGLLLALDVMKEADLLLNE